MSHIGVSMILPKESHKAYKTRSSLPVNFTNLFTDRYSSDHEATHKSEQRMGGKPGDPYTPRLHAVGVYCERITCARMRFVFQRSGKLIPICRPGVKGCRKYECEHLLGASLRDLEASLFTPFAGGFQRMKRERRDTERRERERSGLAPPRD